MSVPKISYDGKSYKIEGIGELRSSAQVMMHLNKLHTELEHLKKEFLTNAPKPALPRIRTVYVLDPEEPWYDYEVDNIGGSFERLIWAFTDGNEDSIIIIFYTYSDASLQEGFNDYFVDDNDDDLNASTMIIQDGDVQMLIAHIYKY